MSLADPYLKTTRAKKHLDTLREEVSRFIKGDAYRFTYEDDVENQRYLLRVKLMPAPSAIPLIVGDCCYCLRSALDQLAWSLAKIATPTPPRTIQFPIQERRNQRVLQLRTRGMPSRAVRIIKSLQPYHRRDSVADHLLWRLNAICNVDKHRRIPVDTTFIDFKLPPAIMRIAKLETFDNGGIVSVPLGAKSQMKLHPTCSIGITFGDTDSGVCLTADDIADIYNFVTHDVLPRFAGFFPESKGGR